MHHIIPAHQKAWRVAEHLIPLAKILEKQARQRYMSYSLINSLKGLFGGSYRGLLKGLLRGIPGDWFICHSRTA